MNYLNDWVDISKIKSSGWSGSPSFDNENKYLLLTAINGWRSFYWKIPEIENKDITVEFDYKFISTDNWSNCWVININGYDGISNGNIAKVTEWTHYKKKFMSTSSYIGINVRGVDNTGKSVVMALKNVQLFIGNDSSNQIYKTGNFVTEEVIEGNSFNVCPHYIEVNEIWEI